MSSIAIKHCIFQFFILNCYPSLQRGSSAGPFVEFLCLKVLPSLKQVTEEETRQELLQLMAEGCLCPVDSDMAVKCLEPVFNCLLVSVHGPRATNTPLLWCCSYNLLCIPSSTCSVLVDNYILSTPFCRLRCPSLLPRERRPLSSCSL